ncbi:murein L,D-transpeptidase catalytic domain family protein [Chitinophaga horti]|uniref:Murein L,D-transpeptidase catalytic domain family protein n=1 Tax=Chitinophaga horti TaxID=2920382 RepID=A0ABY6IZI0_9BACT|nr:murein L,D-transpeptidase catalytic domain family protein [Chitinophaga horti]UYQ92796.1 murein L,D-transpeptidase catalytic domain family protein [Chitinophaga horti]
MPVKPVFFFYFLLIGCLFACNPRKQNKSGHTTEADDEPVKKLDLVRLKKKAAALKEYAMLNKYNTKYALLIDFHVRSGRKRFVLYDLEQNKPINMALVAHGQGSNYLTEDVPFSNVEGSKCSSPGRYKIGAKYYGKFGWAYKLHGLSNTNSNAFKRFVVLHAHSCVPESENFLGICRSDGCPTLNPDYFAELQLLLDKQKKPVLLEIYK